MHACSHFLTRDAHEITARLSRCDYLNATHVIKPPPCAGIKHLRLSAKKPFAGLSRCRTGQNRRAVDSCASTKRSAMLYFVWYDDNAKKPVVEKIQEAIAAYVTRFAIQPSLMLVNAVDLMEFANVLIRAERTVQPNTFWLAYEEIAEVPTA